MNTLTFNDVNFNPVQQNGQIWLTTGELAKALGYSDQKGVTRSYNRNKDEFTPSMTQIIEINEGVKSTPSSKTKGLVVKARIFSLRGCYAIAMFARTDIAKQFRKWVLDILDKEVGAAVQVNQLSTTTDRRPLVEAVNIYCAKSGSFFGDIWKMIHQRFNVVDVSHLTIEQIPQAVEYVHKFIVKPEVKETALSSFTHNQYIMNVKNEIMDYVYSLQKEIMANGGDLPKYPAFDKEEICRSFITSMIRHNRMMLSFDYKGSPAISFIPEEHAVVSSENIASVVQFADKKQLPNIINEAVKRLGK